MKHTIRRSGPQALFACAIESCAEEVTWPADDLYWCEEHQAWICADCLEYLNLEQGKSLKQWLMASDPPIRGFL